MTPGKAALDTLGGDRRGPNGRREETRIRGKTLLVLLVIGIAAAAGVVSFARAAGPQGGARVGQPAPEITGGPWINSEPLNMQNLRGRVVYVEFWTYG